MEIKCKSINTNILIILLIISSVFIFPGCSTLKNRTLDSVRYNNEKNKIFNKYPNIKTLEQQNQLEAYLNTLSFSSYKIIKFTNLINKLKEKKSEFQKNIINLIKPCYLKKYPPEWNPTTPLGELIDKAGFYYTPNQDIICSKMCNMQRSLGFCKVYDDFSFVISSIIDCEPIKFTYDGYEWMIELWKGQYGIETGAEIGVYKRKIKSDINDPFIKIEQHLQKLHLCNFKDCYIYKCVPDDDRLKMSFSLESKRSDDQLNPTIFSRNEKKHWWLTGFKWGKYYEPTDIKLKVSIEFKNKDMKDSFVNIITNCSYNYTIDKIISNNDLTVTFTFDKPKSKQPNIDMFMDGIGKDVILEYNYLLVTGYNSIKRLIKYDKNNPDEIYNRIKNKIDNEGYTFENIFLQEFLQKFLIPFWELKL